MQIVDGSIKAAVLVSCTNMAVVDNLVVSIIVTGTPRWKYSGRRQLRLGGQKQQLVVAALYEPPSRIAWRRCTYMYRTHGTFLFPHNLICQDLCCVGMNLIHKNRDPERLHMRLDSSALSVKFIFGRNHWSGAPSRICVDKTEPMFCSVSLSP